MHDLQQAKRHLIRSHELWELATVTSGQSNYHELAAAEIAQAIRALGYELKADVMTRKSGSLGNIPLIQFLVAALIASHRTINQQTAVAVVQEKINGEQATRDVLAFEAAGVK
jgi:hypothetical protein